MAENENIILTDIAVTETNEPVQIDETIQVIEFDDVRPFEIETDDAFAALGEPNAQLRHSLLTERENLNQHPIIAIEGLRQELDDIEALKIVYSDKKQQADYYLWHDENTANESRIGYFVAMHQADEHDQLHSALCCIEICDGTRDVFGVTVAEAGFIGGQEYLEAADGTKVGRDNRYGLVVHSGLVAVQCESDVQIGDYVTSNSDGVAAKTNGNYGYLVVTMSDIHGVMHAVISLTPSSMVAQVVADELEDLGERMASAEYNITSVTNVANSAYAMAQDAKNTTNAELEAMKGQVNDAVGKVESMGGTVSELDEIISSTATTAAQAKVIAEGAVSSAESIRSEAVAKANEASENVNNLIKDLEPIITWRDPTTGNTGAEYLTTYINDGLATKIEVQTASTKAEEAWSAMEKNAKSIQSLVQKIDKYSLSEWSQAYGLTHEQAKTILPTNIVYVPTLNHEETYDAYTQEFLKGYYYTWNGESWDASKSVSVAFSNVYMAGAEGFYWVVTDQDIEVKNADGEVTGTYDLGGLYLYENGAWVKVASAYDSVLNRAISSVRQTANEIAAEVVDARGGAASLRVRIDENTSSVTTLASHLIGDYISVETWDSTDKDINKVYHANDTNLYWYYKDGAWASTEKTYEARLSGTMATIQQQADDDGASIAQIVEAVGSDGEVNAASIVTAINNDTSGVIISAEHINLKGKVTFESFDEETRQQIEADTIDVQIWSSRGNIFKSGDVTTILTCHVFKAGVDITNSLPSSAFTWEKLHNDGTVDTEWRATPYGNHGNPIQISPSDVWSRAVFNCKVEI
jgi:hypothetical protein